MDYRDFNFRTVVDWIEIEIQTITATHYDAIRRHGELSYVEPIDPSAEGKSATTFRFRIHDPANWHEVASAVGNIAKKFALAKPFDVVGIEVALDAYGHGNTTQEEFASVAASFAKFTTHTHENRRMYREMGEGSFAPPTRFTTLVRHLAEGWQIGVGDKNSDCYQHIYFKTTDHNKAPLPVSEYRARIEITLRGNELPCNTHEEWSRCKFAALAKPYFSFRKLQPDLSPLEKVNAEVDMRIGRRAIRNRREGGTRLFSRVTRADSSLNTLARYKLRDLSDRWQTHHARRVGVRKGILACGNSGNAKSGITYRPAKAPANSDNYISTDLLSNCFMLPQQL